MAQSAANFDYQDFDPFFEWSQDEGSATLVVMLPGFTKEQLRVQVTSTPVLRINGERQIVQNKRRRFSKEFSIPPYCDTNDVSAKFEGGVLSIKFPKLIAPAASSQPQSQPQQAPMPQKEKEPLAQHQDESLEKEKEQPILSDKKIEEEDAQKKVSSTNGVPATMSSKQRITQRLKTRVLDFTTESLRSVEEEDVKQGFKYAKLIKRPKIWMNIFVVILFVMVLGLYVNNAFRSSQEFKEF